MARQPLRKAHKNTVATMMNAVAVPSSKTKWRRIIPRMIVVSQMITPVRSSSGFFQACDANQPTTAAMTKGAATRKIPDAASPSSWFRRPIATKITMHKTSATADQRTTLDFMTSSFVEFFNRYNSVVIGNSAGIFVDSGVNEHVSLGPVHLNRT